MRHRRLAPALALTLALGALTIPQQASAAPAHNSAVDSTGCSATTSPLTLGQTTAQTISSGGLTRSYLVHMPSTYVPGQLKPLVMVFHGHKGTAADIESYTGFDSADAVLAYPTGVLGTDNGTAWQGAPYNATGVDDVQFVADLLDKLQSQLCIDKSRIFAAGKSNGGGFVGLLACQLPNRIAAFGIVAGAFYDATQSGCGANPPGVPIIDFHGTNDTIVDYDGDLDSHGETLPAIQTWLAGWAVRDNCTTGPTQTVLDTEVIRYAWSSCQSSVDVVHYKILGHGHTWPGAADSGPGTHTIQINATTAIWSYFTAHPRSWF
ncbi:alpha/beta hydrolase family esterase [Actinokineospora enzanensis]|uniref:alpha/beta hydrolase family esterase n=1 Tax=Actinokineospora enzanensis TaxID=155975 RepID=UPI00037BC432|nr:PHB depolymerase family esterase [Actinokineospora enzanensis]